MSRYFFIFHMWWYQYHFVEILGKNVRIIIKIHHKLAETLAQPSNCIQPKYTGWRGTVMDCGWMNQNGIQWWIINLCWSCWLFYEKWNRYTCRLHEQLQSLVLWDYMNETKTGMVTVTVNAKEDMKGLRNCYSFHNIKVNLHFHRFRSDFADTVLLGDLVGQFWLIANDC